MRACTNHAVLNNRYFFWDLPTIFEDFKQTLFRPDAAPGIAEAFYACCMEPFHGMRMTQLKAHIALSATCGFLMTLQLLPQVRTKNYARHKLIGYVTNLLTFIFIIHMTYLLFIRGIAGLPIIIFWFDVAAYIAIVVGFVLGFAAIANRNIESHRKWMMLCSSGMYANATQRFFWAILSRTNTTMQTFQDWVDGPLTISSILALVVVFATALYYGWVTKTLSIDRSRAKVENKVH